MRSQILSWLLGMVGFEVFRLKGGYKTYRGFTFEEVRKERKLIVLGGKTGTGKTVLLKALQAKGEQLLDLEDLANHKGSSFGAIGQAPQPTVEQFENLMAEALLITDPTVPLWVENESRKIGKTIIPESFFNQMETAFLINIHKSLEERIRHIEFEYAKLPKEELIQAVQRLQKRLGGLRTHQAIEDIQNGNNSSWISNLLIYYDKTYQFDLQRHEQSKIVTLDLNNLSEEAQINLLLQAKHQFYGN